MHTATISQLILLIRWLWLPDFDIHNAISLSLLVQLSIIVELEEHHLYPQYAVVDAC